MESRLKTDDLQGFCGATGTLCFEFWLIVSIGFKAKVDLSSPMLCSCLHVWIISVDSEFADLGQVPVLHLGMVRLPLEGPLNVTFRTTATFEPMTSRPKAPNSIDRAIPAVLIYKCLLPCTGNKILLNLKTPCS